MLQFATKPNVISNVRNLLVLTIKDPTMYKFNYLKISQQFRFHRMLPPPPAAAIPPAPPADDADDDDEDGDDDN